MRTLFIIWLTAAAVCPGMEAGAASVASFSGFMTEVGFHGDPTNNLILTSNYSTFQATVAADGKYLFNLQESNGLERYYGFDGTDTYVLEYHQQASLNTSTGAPSNKSVPLAFISRGCFPCDNRVIFGGVLWAAYGAGVFLHTNSALAAYPLPFRMVRLDASVYGFRYEADLEDAAPFLPRKIVYYRNSGGDLSPENPLANSELDAITGTDDPDKYQKQIRWLKKRYNQDGFRALEFISEDFTNVNGVSFPQTFTLRAFNPRWESALPTLVVSGKVLKIQDVEAGGNFRPPIRTQLEVVDNRFRWRNQSSTVDGIVYPVKLKENWKPADDPYLVNIFQQEIKAPQSTRNVSIRKLTVILSMLVVFAAFPIWLMRGYLRRHKSGASG